jgi:predicted RNA-binding Zn-ribbon protein involved in translation (DUF1610 family)
MRPFDRTATPAKLTCPPCDVDKGRPADQRVGESGRWYACPDCGDEWREAHWWRR